MNRIGFARCICAIIIAFALSLASTVPHRAAPVNRKLSGEMINEGDIENFIISPDGRYVVFCANRETAGNYDLFSVPMTGGEPVKLNNTETGSKIYCDLDPTYYQISGDSQWVVFIAHLEDTSKRELFYVPILGGTPIVLNDTLVENGEVIHMNITPQPVNPYGYVVVYLADQQEDEKFELYGVSISTGAAGKYNGTLVTDGDVQGFMISPNGQWVVYRADQHTDEVYELYSNMIDGVGWVKLNDTLSAGQSVADYFLITPNSQGVVFAYNSDGPSSKLQLFSNFISGGTPIELSDITFDAASVFGFVVTPNSLGVVYIADQETDEVLELYSNYITGGTSQKISGTLSDYEDVAFFKITPNNQGVVFLTGDISGSEPYMELRSNYITRGTTPFVVDTYIYSDFSFTFDITNNSLGVVYMSERETEGVIQLYIKSIMGGSPQKLNSALIPWGDVHSFRLTPNNIGVVYVADQDTNDVNELFGNTMISGTPFKLNGSLVDNGDVQEDTYQISPDSKAVVYIADQEEDEKYELYVTYFLYYASLPLISNPESR